MKTKKNYMIPSMKAVKLESVTLLAGSGEMGIGATIGGRGNIEDPEDDE
ncbi:hypothetical protein SAMN06298211_1104 [Prevotellaceae bacterium MN60]|nr:hypothetical protein SAMN06298211_1104 [Prevotellaceae bacterium MN60]